MRFVIFKSKKNGQWYWKLLAANNRSVAVGGEGYKTRQGAEHGLAVVRKGANVAPIKVLP